MYGLRSMSTVATTIRDAVYRTIEVVNELLPPEQALLAHDGLVLVGKSSSLDSMGFVNFIVTLEEELERRLGRALDIADFLSLQSDDSGSISTVADLINRLSERLG